MNSSRFLWFIAMLGIVAFLSSGLRAAPAIPERPRMEVVFVLDTTGSMASMIEGAKRKIWSVASRLKSAQPTPEIRFGLVAYRDRGDAYVTQVFPLTADLDEVYGKLMSFQAEGGGDTPEAVNQALERALNGIVWTADQQVLQAIFLVGDAPPHMDYADDVPWSRLARQARERGILINGIQCGEDRETSEVWHEVARLSGGAASRIMAANRTIAIDTRFDADIVGMNRALNATIIPYGSSAVKESVGRSRALVEVMTAEGVADRVAFLHRDGFGAVTTGGGDLVTEILAARVTAETADVNLLDPALATKSAGERVAEIQQRVERRRQLLADLAGLLQLREAAVNQRMASAKSDDEAITLSPFAVVEEQARARGYRFEGK